MRRAERRAGWWFIGPAALVLVLMLAFPLGYTVYLSFFEWFAAGGPPRFAGLANYVQIATDSRFLWAVGRTLLYTVLAVGFEVILGIALALLFERPFVGRGPARTLFLLPMVATPVAIALVWLLMFDPATGVLNYLLTLVGLPKSVWVNDRWLALPSLVLVDVWQWTPLVMLIVLGGLTSLPREPFEAARIDGASRWQAFRYLTLPMLRPYIVVAALFRGIDALKTFDSIYVLTRGGPGFASETLNLYIYASAFDYLHMGYSSAMLVVFFVLILALSAALIAVRRRTA
ncbi:MAG TPA: sugar ABC transporter permease [Casimicrobiaceae bacterium]